jgi:predicted small lipoprotein YifL
MSPGGTAARCADLRPRCACAAFGAAAALAALLSGCGQKGPLYLPDKNAAVVTAPTQPAPPATTAPAITAPATTAPASTPSAPTPAAAPDTAAPPAQTPDQTKKPDPDDSQSPQ